MSLFLDFFYLRGREKNFRSYPLTRRSYENGIVDKMDQQIQSTFIFKTMETPLENPLEAISFKIKRKQAT